MIYQQGGVPYGIDTRPAEWELAPKPQDNYQAGHPIGGIPEGRSVSQANLLYFSYSINPICTILPICYPTG